MTPCENYWEALNAFVDGECSPEEEAALRAHLADCAACREALAELNALHDGFPDWEDDGMDDILMGIPRLLCLRCCYFKGDGVTFFGIGQ